MINLTPSNVCPGKDEGIKDSDFGEGKGDNDVDEGFVPAPLVLRRVLGTLAEVCSARAVSLYSASAVSFCLLGPCHVLATGSGSGSPSRLPLS